ncbi:hypothetical protein [Fodinibius sediminis]|uniref:Uncharacterized protein n=1 Tax=Fodinibius sediminis TaxID=1214077 RepID=A0A521ECS9_9BACT|nr:hypothetical protein [Fodinibius sediminis]SMO81727.1 hypothetical protein SAMN06265218_11515 [Fodinibius sediminis]
MDLDFKKAEQALDNLSFSERLKSIGNLVKHTFTIIGKDEDIIKPWIRMLIYNLIMVSGLFYAWLGWWYDLPLEGWSLFLAIALFFYKYFYYNKQEVRLSHIVYETIIGNDPSFTSAVAACKPIQSQTRKIAWIDIGMAFVGKAKQQSGGGFLMTLIRFFINGVEEVWDLINHYLLPSVAVDHLDITPAVKKMKKLKDQVPESLVGVFGIDFLGSVTRKIVLPIYFGLGIVSIALGIYLAGSLPSTVIQGAEVPTDYWFETLQFSWIPVIIALWMGKLFSSVIERTVTGIKVIYFTIFYTKITHPDRIMDSLQEELVDYLKLEEVDEVENLDEQGVEAPSPA